MRRVIVVSFFLSTLLNAEQNTEVIKALEYDKVQSKLVVEKPVDEVQTNKPKITTDESIVKKYKYDSARQHMLRKAKYLKKKYEAALLKFDNWEMKKELLKKTFRQKNRRQDTAFGAGNNYGKIRAKKREKEYFKSLEEQEKHIVNRVDSTYSKLADIKEEFLFKYAVPLTDEEIKGLGVPVLADKDKKVQMLNEYINESTAWKKCREKVNEFDKVNRVADSIEKLFPASNLTPATISEKMQENKLNMEEHANRYQGIEQEYQEKYGLSIMSDKRAQEILANINNN